MSLMKNYGAYKILKAFVGKGIVRSVIAVALIPVANRLWRSWVEKREQVITDVKTEVKNRTAA